MSILEDRKTCKEVQILVSSSRSKFITIWKSFNANMGLFKYSLGNKVKQLLGGAYENGDQMFAMSPKGPWKSWEKASTTKDVKDQNIPKHTRSE